MGQHDSGARSDVPPPRLRSDLRDDERAQIVAVVGQLSTELALPLRDGRGKTFQRMEFVGDSVLDVLLAAHALVDTSCRGCRGIPMDVGRLVTDKQLARQAAAIGLGTWLEWNASPERLADLVEACTAAAWLGGGWEQAALFARRAVHPLSAECIRTLMGRRGAPVSVTGSRGERRLGAALLELAAAMTAFSDYPEADEGELSRRRAERHRIARVAEHARRTPALFAAGEDAVVSDHVEAWLAREALTHGADVGLQHATTVLG